MPFRIVRNDIKKMNTEVIVSAADSDVIVGGGVDSAVYHAAGMEELLAGRRQAGRLKAGEVAVTSAGRLSCRYVFHVCSPVFVDGSRGEERALKGCYEKCLALAAEKKCESIAFPLLSAGTNGYPAGAALEAAVAVCRDFLQTQDMGIYLVVFDKEAAALSGRLFPDVRAYVDEHYVETALEQEYAGRRGRALLRSAADRESSRAKDYEPIDCYAEDEQNENGRDYHVTNRQVKDKREKAQSEKRSRGNRQDIRGEKGAGNRMPEAAFAAAPAAAPLALDDFIRQNAGSFEEYLQQLINRKGMTNAEVYKKANLSKQYFSKVMHGQVKPTKEKLLCIAVALKLNLDETADFLRLAGYALSPCSKTDLVFEYFIVRRNFDIFSIDIALFDCGLPSLMD